VGEDLLKSHDAPKSNVDRVLKHRSPIPFRDAFHSAGSLSRSSSLLLALASSVSLLSRFCRATNNIRERETARAGTTHHRCIIVTSRLAIVSRRIFNPVDTFKIKRYPHSKVSNRFDLAIAAIPVLTAIQICIPSNRISERSVDIFRPLGNWRGRTPRVHDPT